MVSLKAWETTVPDDRKVVVEFPKNIPVGTTVKVNVLQADGIEVRVEVGETLANAAPPIPTNPLREKLREKMAAAGILSMVTLPPDLPIPTLEEFRAAQARTAALGGRSIDDLIAEDRGEW